MSFLSANVGGPVVSVLTVIVAPSVGLIVGTSGNLMNVVGIGVPPPPPPVGGGDGGYVGNGVPGTEGVGGVG